MARDFDFKRRSGGKTVGQLPPTNPKATPLLEAPRPRRFLWFWLLLVLLIGAALSYFFFRSIEPVATAPTPPAAGSSQIISSEALSSSPETVVSVYDSGAGELAVKNLVTTLIDRHYPAADLGKSQFQYDQTFIWYQPEYEPTVQAMVKLLGNKKTVLRQYQGAGPYKILIQLGP